MDTNKQKPISAPAAGKESHKAGKNPFKKQNVRRNAVTSCSKGNDPAWYSSDAGLVSASARLTFANPVGEAIRDVINYESPNFPLQGVPTNTPGILKIPYVPTIGISANASSAINLASIKLYSYVRHANSGSRNYERADQTLIYVAIMNVVATLAAAQRIYGLCQVYNRYNRYYPRAIINSMFENNTAFDDLIQNLANYYFRINVLINKLSALAIPSGMSVLDRWVWMNSHVWLDANSDKAMVVYYMPSGMYKFNPKHANGTSLDYVRFALGNGATFSDILNKVESSLNELMGDEDVGIICGDIIKAFGSDRLVHVDSIPADYTVVPEYNLEVLQQIHHVYTWGNVKPTSGTGEVSVLQENGDIIFRAIYDTNIGQSIGATFNRYILSAVTPDVTEGDVLVMTRMMCDAGVEDATAGTVGIYSCGTELAETMKIFYLKNGVLEKIQFNTVEDWTGTATAALISQRTELLAAIDKMDYHPPLVRMSGTSDGTPMRADLIMDYDYYTFISNSELAKLHETAVLNEFSIASISTTLGSK